jgi:hypothetical protein
MGRCAGGNASIYFFENRYSNALVSPGSGTPGPLDPGIELDSGSAGNILCSDSRVMLYTSRWPREVSSEIRVESRANGFSGNGGFVELQESLSQTEVSRPNAGS